MAPKKQPSTPLPTTMDEQALLDHWTTVMVGLGAYPEDTRVEATGLDLLSRWQEPHRHYHGPPHLVAGIEALRELGAEPLEHVAWWFHDAVHHNDPPWDEQRSAALAREVLPALLGPEQVTEVARLVLLTINHDPRPEDDPGKRVCDADLAMVAAPWPVYQQTVGLLRAERPGMAPAVWDSVRISFTGRMLNREWLFQTHTGRTQWEHQARQNLVAERRALFAPTPPVQTTTSTEEPTR